MGKVLILFLFHETSAGKMIASRINRAINSEKKNVNAYSMAMNERKNNYVFQNADTRPHLQSRTQNICFVISISAVILKRMVKITSIFGPYRLLRVHPRYDQAGAAQAI